MLSIWDSQLIKYGNYIFRERENLVNELIPVFQEYYSFITEDKELVKLSYRSHLVKGNSGKFSGMHSEKTGSLNIQLLGYIRMIWVLK